MPSLFASETELVILKLLQVAPGGCYGLELVAADARVKRGSVYVTLNRMRDKGLVQSRKPQRRRHAGMARPRYTLTARGAKVLQAAEFLLV